MHFSQFSMIANIWRHYELIKNVYYTAHFKFPIFISIKKNNNNQQKQ